jgi:hypothetical protein
MNSTTDTDDVEQLQLRTARSLVVINAGGRVGFGAHG